MTLMRDKRFLILLVLMALLCAEFWAGSRYPALNEKLLMGTDTPLSGLAFSQLVDVPPDASLVPRIFYTTINWMYTNRQGMSFGILFGALLMTSLRLIERRSVQSRMGNSALGMLIGAPLGVCTNCAAPIAKAIHAGGGRLETMLAVMVSSPTLNVIVLTMLLALFPFYVAVIKIGLTLAVILIVIPLLTRLFSTPDTATAKVSTSASSLHAIGRAGDSTIAPISPSVDSQMAWPKAIRWTARTIAVDLWFIVKTTVPLMILAGFLGSVVISTVPLESLGNLLPTTGRVKTALAMAGVALLGVFLPVPMSFDVIVTAILWHAGLPIKYAMVLLFTLGIFSVFPFLIVWRAIGPRIAGGLFMGLAALGVMAGALGDQYFNWDYQRQHKIFLETFSQSSAQLRGPKVLRFGGETRVERADGELVASLQRTVMKESPVEQFNLDGITVNRVPFQAPLGAGDATGGAGKMFSRFEGIKFGLDEPYEFSILTFEGPSTQFRGIASGDVHNDGWVDLLFTSASGLSLYANQQGRGFALQQIDIPELKDFHVVNAALVDLNNDGWLDIFLSTYRKGNYVIYNTAGRFFKTDLHRLPDQPSAVMTGAVTFGDVDKDGYLDIAMGSWAHPQMHGGAPRVANTILLRNDKGQFRVQPLEVIPDQTLSRQTLSMLFSDINNDGHLDLIVGNEDLAPDNFYLGTGNGGFRPITRNAGAIPHSSGSTMSVASADVNNDLSPEIYLGQITSSPAEKYRDVGPAICDEIGDTGHKKNCQAIMKVHQGMPSQARTQHPANCMSAVAQEYREDCIAYSLLLWARHHGPEKMCDLFPDPWAAFRFVCHRGFADMDGPPYAKSGGRKAPGSRALDDGQSIPAKYGPNVLLMPTGDGRFVDKAGEMGVQIAGFTWNAKFADLDNDEFVDLLAVQGWFNDPKRVSNFFFHNQQGKRFIDKTAEAGLTSFLSTSAYTFVDIDNDGDLDIVSVPIAGPVLVYLNNSKKNRIAFEIRDHVGNRFGVGGKVIIHYGPGGARHQVREIQSGGGFVSFDAPVAYFGLGEYQRVDRVEIRWSTGERSEIRGDFSAGSRYIVSRPNNNDVKSSRPGRSHGAAPG